MEHFDAVWQRVTGGASPKERPRRETDPVCRELKELMTRQQTLWRWYTDLAGRTKGEVSRSMSQLARQVQLRSRELQREYFMRTGDICRLSQPVSQRGGVLTGMQQAHRKEMELAQRFHQAAEKAEPRLGELYHACGKEGKERANRLRGYIGRAIQ